MTQAGGSKNTVRLTHWGHLEVLQHVVKIMELGELQLHHLVLQLQQTSHDSFQNRAHHSPLLRVHHLVVHLLQVAHDLQVLQVEAGQCLKDLQAISLRTRLDSRELILKEAL